MIKLYLAAKLSSSNSIVVCYFFFCYFRRYIYFFLKSVSSAYQLLSVSDAILFCVTKIHPHATRTYIYTCNGTIKLTYRCRVRSYFNCRNYFLVKNRHGPNHFGMTFLYPASKQQLAFIFCNSNRYLGNDIYFLVL